MAETIVKPTICLSDSQPKIYGQLRADRERLLITTGLVIFFIAGLFALNPNKTAQSDLTGLTKPVKMNRTQSWISLYSGKQLRF